MRLEDAPPAGWYPDPEGGSRLRWWEGTDWSDRYRAPPTRSEVDRRTLVSTAWEDDDDHHVRPEEYRLPAGAVSRRDADAMVEQVRLAARAEAERAAQMFGDQARSATRELQPLITQYTSRITRWIRFLAVIAILLFIVYIAFQLFAQASLFDWIGDRIDNLSENLNEDSGAILNPFRS